MAASKERRCEVAEVLLLYLLTPPAKNITFEVLDQEERLEMVAGELGIPAEKLREVLEEIRNHGIASVAEGVRP